LLKSAATHCRDAATSLLGHWGPAVAAQSLVCAIEDLRAVGSTDAREAVLDKLFERFCIGK
jgi:tRNA U34 5-carboxymethylaminomethyl modifying GTPase MnmE/TrmE